MLFLSVVIIGELEAGLETMEDAERRKRLKDSLERYLSLISGESVLRVTRAIATRWGNFTAAAKWLVSPERPGWNDCRHSL